MRRDDEFWDVVQQLIAVVFICLTIGWLVQRVAPMPRRVVGPDPVIVIHKTVRKPIELPPHFERMRVDPVGETLTEGVLLDLVWRPSPRLPPAEESEYLLPWPSLSSVETVKGVTHAPRRARERRADVRHHSAANTVWTAPHNFTRRAFASGS